MSNKISVVGLGKLGQPFAVCLAARGYEVLGIDIDVEVVHSLNIEGVATIQEPHLQELLYDHIDNMWFSTDLAQAIECTDLTFIIVNTPSLPDGTFSASNLVAALEMLGEALADSNYAYHTFVVGSTVSPGAAEQHLIPALVRHVDRARFGYAYCPELVALGDVVRGFLYPDFVTIGTDDDRVWPIVHRIYSRLAPDASIKGLSVGEAEIFKVALNFFLTMKISFANTLAGVCEQFPGADVDRISEVLGQDRRIAPAFLRGGMAFGGYCFPRDVAAFSALPSRTTQPINLALAIQTVNAMQNHHVLMRVLDAGADRVSVLGLSFKPGTPEIEASPALELVEGLLARDIEARVHDPMATMPKAWLGDVVFAPNAKACAGCSPIVVLATAWPEYGELTEDDFQEGATVLDCWRLLPHLRDSKRVRYEAIGLGG